MESIQNQIEAAKRGSFAFVDNALKYLPQIIQDDETINIIICGIKEENEKNGILVSTNKRIIWIAKTMLSNEIQDFTFDKISSIQYEGGILFGLVKMQISGGNFEVGNISKSAAEEFTESVRQSIDNPVKKEKVSADDIIEKLERLKVLKESGALTEVEFEEQKKRILDS